MGKRKLLKFDIIHPPEYLSQVKKSWDIDHLSRTEYTQKLINLRSNYSDFYTHHLNQTSDWEAEEFFLLDDDFVEKTAQTLWGKKLSFVKTKHRLKQQLGLNQLEWHQYVIHHYIEHYNPDVIFVRSQPLPSSFWQRYRKNSLIVARLSARLPYNWHPNDFDMIYTDQPDFKTFFDFHGVNTIINKQGFDSRINSELKHDLEKKYDTVFVGGLGTENFSQRTVFLEALAAKINFKWWGYWWKFGRSKNTLEEFENLNKSFQGPTSGLEMFQIYADSKIVVNDYVDTANGIGFNQRMFEVMGCGGFLLTREARNFEKDFPDDIFVTYSDLEDCTRKIKYYLEHEEERRSIAERAKKYVNLNYNYKDISIQMGKDFLAVFESQN